MSGLIASRVDAGQLLRAEHRFAHDRAAPREAEHSEESFMGKGRQLAHAHLGQGICLGSLIGSDRSILYGLRQCIRGRGRNRRIEFGVVDAQP